MSEPQDRLSQRIGHAFQRPELLRRALTHRSAGRENNERLEFLGDAVLNFVVGQALYDAYPDATEGELTRYRARLVSGATLAEMAREQGLGPHLELGPGELKSGGRDRGSILADALEAVVGAVLLDGGFDAARQVILDLFGERFVDVSSVSLKDPKTRLQEFLQARRLPLPDYEIVDVEGADHHRSYLVECRVHGRTDPVRARGSSRRKAEQAAALKALERMEHG